MVTYTRRFDVTQKTIITTTRKSDGFTTVAESDSKDLWWQATCSFDKVGGENPSWRDMVRKHQDATTGFTGIKRFVRASSPGSWNSVVIADNTPAIGFVRKTEVSGKGVFPINVSYNTNSGDALNQALAIARGKFIKRIVDENRKWNSLQFVGEFREALTMLRNPAASMVRLLRELAWQKYNRDLRRAARRGGRRAPKRYRKDNVNKAIAENWLWFSYGVDPLISDMKSGYDAIRKLVNESPVSYKLINGKGTATVQISGMTSNQTGSLGGMAYRRHQSTTSTARARIYGELRHTRSIGADLSRIGLSWGNFVPTLWELLPYSFLVDSIVNVGEVLDGAFVDLSSVIRRSTVYTIDRERKFTFEVLPINSNYSCSGSQPAVTLVDRLVGRALGADISWVPLRCKLMESDSLRKLANLAALAVINYRGLSRDVANLVR